jgi:hypothetical protein
MCPVSTRKTAKKNEVTEGKSAPYTHAPVMGAVKGAHRNRLGIANITIGIPRRHQKVRDLRATSNHDYPPSPWVVHLAWHVRSE